MPVSLCGETSRHDLIAFHQGLVTDRKSAPPCAINGPESYLNVRWEPMMEDLTQEIRALREEVRALQVKQNFVYLMTPAQCAEYLNRSEEVLYLWRKERNAGQDSVPPFLHISTRTILYDREDVLAWARSNRVK